MTDEEARRVKAMLERLYDAVDPNIRRTGFIALSKNQFGDAYSAVTYLLAQLIVAGDVSAAEMGNMLGNAVSNVKALADATVIGHA